ncbi:MAG: DUF1822 family protein [Chroococcidiopsidaceae cyanobacterium CP_BM_RX_35]|nr:DUF1822 family protein [Chroococcidiopsidaceae cyanobacterium CP_BM_RX_35]
MNSTQTPLLTVPLGREAHTIAGRFAALQATPQKGKQVYLNILAVYAVHSYLKWVQIDTNLERGNSWQPSLQAVFDCTDLVIPGAGKLECRPVLPGGTRFSLLPQETADRIGYVAVQFKESLDSVQLLGFTTTDDAPELAITALQPLDTLLDYIPEVVDVPTATVSRTLIHLSRWLENTFEVGWQTVEALFSAEADLAFSVRSAERSNEFGVSGGKLIDLGIQLAGHPFALVVTLMPAATAEAEEIDIRLRVYPTGNQISLPPHLQLTVLDEFDTASLVAEARSTDNWLQLEFSGQLGERFSVKVALGNISITEYFVI